jgi:hypothetical protein
MIEDTTEEDVEEALRRQDEALALLEQLRVRESASAQTSENSGGGRRDFRRWPAPKGITAETHDGTRWQPAQCSDFGIGGARLSAIPTWLNGPVPVRLKGTTGTAVLALGDLMWRDGANDAAGLRLEFQDTEERDLWTATLIDALLARYALV